MKQYIYLLLEKVYFYFTYQTNTQHCTSFQNKQVIYIEKIFFFNLLNQQAIVLVLITKLIKKIDFYT